MLKLHSSKQTSIRYLVCLQLFFFCNLFLSKTIIAQNVSTGSRVITGQVTGENSEPLPGVTVQLKGADESTITDVNGSFSLTVNSDAKTLIFSYVGMETQEVSISEKSNIIINLTPVDRSLGEVVVVGYGTQKKSDLTSAVSTVDVKQLENKPIPNLSQGLQGLVPGLTVTRNSGGVPGSTANIVIRGNTSVNSSGPLVIIDGVPGTMDLVNPDDVSSISILKDASSTAIYGARAAEGVILITTKSGTFNQPLEVGYQTNFSLQKPGIYPKANNSIDNATLGNLAVSNAGGAPLYTENDIALYSDPTITAYPNSNNTDWNYVANVDWQKILFNDALQQSHQLSLTGGSEKLSYRISGGLFNQDGMFAKFGPDNYLRKNLRSNFSASLVPSKLKLNFGFDYANVYRKAPSPGYSYMMQTVETAGSNVPIYNPDGTFARYRQQQNGIQLLEDAGFDNTKIDQLNTKMNLVWTINKNFSATALGGYQIFYSKERAWHRAYGKFTPKGIANMGYINQPNSITVTDNNTKYITGQFQVDYDKTFLTSHHVHVLVGTSVEEQDNSGLSAFRDNIPGNELPSLNIASNANWKNGESEGSWAIASGFARLNYNYKGKYLMQANIRSDGSSRFSNKHRWGTFPSVSAGWKISNESFMKNQSIFSNLKLRASWGETGNQSGLGLYDYIPVYNIGGYYPFGGGTLGQWAVSPQLASEDRTWETVEIKNIGLDIGLIKNKLSFTADYFIKMNKDMLIGIQVPSIIGISVPTGNYGELKTKGWEVNIDWHDNISGKLSYGVSLNLANQNDKLVNNATPFAKPSSGIINLQGYPLRSIFGYEAAGFFQTKDDVTNWPVQNAAINAPGDIKYKDQDGDGKISAPNDLVYLGNTTPHYTFALNLSVAYRDFDFIAFFQGVGKRDYYLTATAMQPFGFTYNNYSFKAQNDYWTVNNSNAYFPRPYLGGPNYQTSSHWVQNGAYLKLKNIQLGFNFPNRISRKIRANNIRIYFSGSDIWTWTKLLMYDPELNTTDGYYYPNPKSYSAGMNITF